MESGGKPHALPKYPPLDCACLWVPHARLLAERGHADRKASFKLSLPASLLAGTAVSFAGLEPGNDPPGAPSSRPAMNSWERQAPAWLFSLAVFSVVRVFPLSVMEGVETVFAGLEPGAPRLRRESQKLCMVSLELDGAVKTKPVRPNYNALISAYGGSMNTVPQDGTQEGNQDLAPANNLRILSDAIAEAVVDEIVQNARIQTTSGAPDGEHLGIVH